MTCFTPPGDHRILPVSLQGRIRWARGDAHRVLELAGHVRAAVGVRSPGITGRHWQGLAELGALDLGAAGVLESHLRALGILEQARGFNPVVFVPDSSTWGCFTGDDTSPNAPLLQADRGQDGNWTLTGCLPDCRPAPGLSHALVGACTSATGRTLFAVGLDQPGVHGAGRLRFDGAAALEVGPENWCRSRPGAAVDGLGPSVLQWGAAAALAQQLHLALADGTVRAAQADVGALKNLGRCDTALFAAGAVLARFARQIDGDDGDDGSGPDLPEALRVRSIVRDACETTLACVRSARESARDDCPSAVELRRQLSRHGPDRDLIAVGAGALDGMPTVWTHR